MRIKVTNEYGDHIIDNINNVDFIDGALAFKSKDRTVAMFAAGNWFFWKK